VNILIEEIRDYFSALVNIRNSFFSMVYYITIISGSTTGNFALFISILEGCISHNRKYINISNGKYNMNKLLPTS